MIGQLTCQVTGVMTQGRGDGSEWVSSFMISYSIDAFHWKYVSDNYGNQRVNINIFIAFQCSLACNITYNNYYCYL